MVFEDYAAQLIQLKVLEEVKTPLLNRGLYPKEAEERPRALLDKVGLGISGIKKKRIWDLSGGQQQRLAIARLRESGKAVLLVSNNIDFVAEVADTVTILEQGRIVYCDRVKKVTGICRARSTL
jgi:energy-coupling factor transport system ATP-binding protein